MMTQTAIDYPALRFERVRLMSDVRHELRLDLAGLGNPAAFVENLQEAITETRSARWRSKTAARASRIAAVHKLLVADLAKRKPVRERAGAGRWSYTAEDDAGRRVLAAEVECPVPRSFADPCPVVVKIKAPQLLLEGETMRRALAATAEAA